LSQGFDGPVHRRHRHLPGIGGNVTGGARPQPNAGMIRPDLDVGAVGSADTPHPSLGKVQVGETLLEGNGKDLGLVVQAQQRSVGNNDFSPGTFIGIQGIVDAEGGVGHQGHPLAGIRIVAQKLSTDDLGDPTHHERLDAGSRHRRGEQADGRGHQPEKSFHGITFLLSLTCDLLQSLLARNRLQQRRRLGRRDFDGMAAR
jgi:hypothetical protein